MSEQVNEQPAEEVVELTKEDLEYLALNSEANLIVKNHMLACMAASLIPVPAVDLAAIVGIQIKMLYELSEHYDVEFSREAARSAIFSLAGGGISLMTMAPLGVSLMKFLPGLGTGAAYVSLPILSGATTYAVGKVFVKHFESGGTLLSFNAKTEQVKNYFQAQLEKGKAFLAKMKKEKPAEETTETTTAETVTTESTATEAKTV